MQLSTTNLNNYLRTRIFHFGNIHTDNRLLNLFEKCYQNFDVLNIFKVTFNKTENVFEFKINNTYHDIGLNILDMNNIFYSLKIKVAFTSNTVAFKACYPFPLPYVLIFRLLLVSDIRREQISSVRRDKKISFHNYSVNSIEDDFIYPEDFNEYHFKNNEFLTFQQMDFEMLKNLYYLDTHLYSSNFSKYPEHKSRAFLDRLSRQHSIPFRINSDDSVFFYLTDYFKSDFDIVTDRKSYLVPFNREMNVFVGSNSLPYYFSLVLGIVLKTNSFHYFISTKPNTFRFQLHYHFNVMNELKDVTKYFVSSPEFERVKEEFQQLSQTISVV